MSIKEAQAIAVVYGEIARFDVIFGRPQMSLENVLKILPPDAVQRIIATLRWAGLIEGET